MQFIPYADELNTINNIHKYNLNSYVIIRLTQTMISKSIIDANGFFRQLLKEYNLLDFDALQEKVYLNGYLVLGNTIHEVKMSCYKANTRGDERFWIYNLATYIRQGTININDLIYITINQNNEILLFNVTNESPDANVLVQLFGQDIIEQSLNRLIPQIKDIATSGYHNNSKGIGVIAPKDAGDTLESLLGIKTNNSKLADYEGVIELKSKTSKSMDTLFTLRPEFDGTPVSQYELNDRYRVSAFTRVYGYNSDKHQGYKSLYITIGSIGNPQNSQGFYLDVNENERRVELRKIENGIDFLAAYWPFDLLRAELYKKHPATLWVKAKSRMNGDIGQFKYIEAELTRTPQFMTFLSLIKTGVITYDWRGYTTPLGRYEGKNHGNAWRIKPKKRTLLFGTTEYINLK